MKIEIEIDDLVGYQFKSDENKVIHFEDMPMDAKIEFYHYNIGYANFYNAYYNEELNRIELC